jgi:RNA polymerase sigma factor (sigma-70 family)
MTCRGTTIRTLSPPSRRSGSVRQHRYPLNALLVIIFRISLVYLLRDTGLMMTSSDFETFVSTAERKLSFALAAAYGPELGREATAEALAYAWEHWDRLSVMSNPIGYLYRVGQSRVRRHRRQRTRTGHDTAKGREPWVEPALPAALAALTQRQRVAVVLVEGFGWTQAEVAELTGTSRSTIQKHLERGLTSLRAELGVETDA